MDMTKPTAILLILLMTLSGCTSPDSDGSDDDVVEKPLLLISASWAEAVDFSNMDEVVSFSIIVNSSTPDSWIGIPTVLDPNGNAVSDAAHAIECENSLLRSENHLQQLVGLGLENIIAIAMPDAVLVAHKDRAQDVKKVVDRLKEQSITQAEIFPKDHRPWGWFESLILSHSFHVKRICVHPGAALSLQSHKYRSEHWIVVDGVAKVTIDDKVELLEAGKSVYVPLGAIHRMENPGTQPMILIEVQIGTYLGEDDIVRYEDAYARHKIGDKVDE